ncbi:hypothetical protein LC55x_1543 [Lysobacter capsici]|nr:hypothetical protein LC55x_1543 [Lysobacter capsici]
MVFDRREVSRGMVNDSAAIRGRRRRCRAMHHPRGPPMTGNTTPLM